jgi:hypothetical protein
MKTISIHALLFCIAISFYGLDQGAAAAANIAPPSLAERSLSKPFLKVGYDCGWDYDCPPRPVYRRYVRRYPRPAHGEVTIHNNYGTVNVYADGHRRYDRRPARAVGCPYTGCGRERVEIVRPAYGCCAPEERREPEPPVYNCGGRPCDSDCGVVCWYRRFKHGYCGHGCQYYRESARDEEEARMVTYTRAPYYEEARPRVEERVVPPRYELPIEAPRRPYKGPPYPPCRGSGC